MSQQPSREELSRQRRQDAFDVEDERWQVQRQARDWALLGALILMSIAWYLIVYGIEPGLRDPDAFLH